MKVHFPLYAIAAALIVMPATGMIAYAQTINTSTTTEQSQPTVGARNINLSDFDLNEDGILSTYEISEMLFKFFDADTNGVIDSKEYERRAIVTVAPMETTKKITYDYDNDGTTDKTEYTFETFTKDTQLARFDKNKDGLSPHEFIGNNFTDVNMDNSRGINVVEWRNAYLSRL